MAKERSIDHLTLICIDINEIFFQKWQHSNNAIRKLPCVLFLFCKQFGFLVYTVVRTYNVRRILVLTQNVNCRRRSGHNAAAQSTIQHRLRSLCACSLHINIAD